MANSLSGDWRAQLRRFSRVQDQTARQLRAWLDRLDALNPASPPRQARRTLPPAPQREHPSEPPPGKWYSQQLRLPPKPGELLPQLGFRLYVPSWAHPREPLPLVVMLHGCRQTPEELAAGTRMNALAEREGFLVAYPQQPLRRQLQRCWQWFDLASEQGGREVQAIAALIDALALEPGVCSDQVYLAGMSAGAAMAAVVALRHPDKIAAVGLHSGVVVGAADTARAGLTAMRAGSVTDPAVLLDAAGIVPGGPAMPAIVMHGLADDAVAPLNGRLLARQFLAYNRLGGALPALAGTPAQALAPGECTEVRFGRWQRDLVVLHEVAGLGHAWSGGDARYGYHADLGPDASAMMWDFFRAHRRWR